MNMKATITHIVAVDKHMAIANGEGLPWNLPGDLRHFRAQTVGHPIIMGRATHDQIGRRLIGRLNIVLTRDRDYVPHDDLCLVAYNIEQALNIARGSNVCTSRIFIIGGAEIYKATGHLAEELYVTRVDTVIDNPTAWYNADHFMDCDKVETDTAWHDPERDEFKHHTDLYVNTRMLFSTE